MKSEEDKVLFFFMEKPMNDQTFMTNKECLRFSWNKDRRTIESVCCYIKDTQLPVVSIGFLTVFQLRHESLKLIVNLQDSCSQAFLVQYNVDGKLVILPDEVFIVSTRQTKNGKLDNNQKRWISDYIYPTGILFKNNLIGMENKV